MYVWNLIQNNRCVRNTVFLPLCIFFCSCAHSLAVLLRTLYATHQYITREHKHTYIETHYTYTIYVCSRKQSNIHMNKCRENIYVTSSEHKSMSINFNWRGKAEWEQKAWHIKNNTVTHTNSLLYRHTVYVNVGGEEESEYDRKKNQWNKIISHYVYEMKCSPLSVSILLIYIFNIRIWVACNTAINSIVTKHNRISNEHKCSGAKKRNGKTVVEPAREKEKSMLSR